MCLVHFWLLILPCSSLFDWLDKNATFMEIHHCHDNHLTLFHFNADVSVHKLHCPQSDPGLWTGVTATSVTSVWSEKHSVGAWKQHVTQINSSTSKPAYTVIRIYWSLYSVRTGRWSAEPLDLVPYQYSALSLAITWGYNMNLNPLCNVTFIYFDFTIT